MYKVIKKLFIKLKSKQINFRKQEEENRYRNFFLMGSGC